MGLPRFFAVLAAIARTRVHTSPPLGKHVAALMAAIIVLAAAERAGAQPLVAETQPLTPAEQRLKFKLPPGFEIQLVAAEPDVHKPMNMKFDAHGRLWITHSLEYPFAAQDPDKARATR